MNDDTQDVTLAQERRPLASASYFSQDKLDLQRFLVGDFWLGRTLSGKAIGWSSELNLLTCAGPGAGKGISTVIPNLLAFPGSAFIIDPKGDLAEATAQYRKEMLGHKVIVLDPANIANVPDDLRGTYNPFEALERPNPFEEVDELNPPKPPDEIKLSAATVAQTLAEGIVVPNPHDKEPYWADNAIDFIQSCILYLLVRKPRTATLMDLRQLVNVGDMELYNLYADNRERDDPKFERSNADAFPMFLKEMLKVEEFGGIVQETAAKLLSLGDKGRGDILGTARTHLDFMKNAELHSVLISEPEEDATKTFTLDEFRRQDRPLTVYMCLPVDMIPRQGRWFRIMLLQIVQYLQRTDRQYKRDEHLPILMMVDEFFQLGPIPSIVNTLTFARSAGLRLWLIVQDLNQIKANYPDTWETVLGACGIKQFFGINDMFSAKYIAELIGEQQIEVQSVSSTKTESDADTESVADTRSRTSSNTEGENRQTSIGKSSTNTESEGFVFTHSDTTNNSISHAKHRSTGGGAGTSANYEYYRGLFGLFQGYSNHPSSGSSSSSTNWNQGDGTTTTQASGRSTSEAKQRSKSMAMGTTASTAHGSQTSRTVADAQGKTISEGKTRTKGTSYAVSVSLQKRQLIRPEDVLTSFTYENQRQLVHIRDYGGMVLLRTRFNKDPYLAQLLTWFEEAIYGAEIPETVIIDIR